MSAKTGMTKHQFERFERLCRSARGVATTRTYDQMEAALQALRAFVDAPASPESYPFQHFHGRQDYPEQYNLRPVHEQVEILKGLFPQLASFDETLVNRPLPRMAEGLFAIPRWQEIGPTYNTATVAVLAKVKKMLSKHGVKNRLFAAMERSELADSEKYLREMLDKQTAMQRLEQQQPENSILLVPAQFGRRRATLSPARLRYVMDPEREFCFGLFEVGAMLLTHPERFASAHALQILCPGDETSCIGNGEYPFLPIFWTWGKEGVVFSTTGEKTVTHHQPLSVGGCVTGFFFK